MNNRSRKNRAEGRGSRRPGKFVDPDVDDTIRDVAHGVLVGCTREDVAAELVRRGFTGEQAFLLSVAGRLLARTIEETR